MEFPKFEEKFFKGRGAQINPFNPFNNANLTQEHFEGLDEALPEPRETQYFIEQPKKILNKLEMPDAAMMYSVNPYQGCEHGCIYCYARNSHNYWGFSAGLDFETKIIVKHNAAELLEKVFMEQKWVPGPVTFSGNTDCYQPVERKLAITRSLLEVCRKFKNPAGIITKNQLILRDIDILKDLAKENLIFVNITITTLKEDLRRQLEPRTSSCGNRLKTIEKLAEAGIPVGVMIGPIIPGLTDSEIPDIMNAAADSGAQTANYTMVRLNGALDKIFTDWIWKTYLMKAEKVLNNIRSTHQGQLNDSRWSLRMRGDGELANSIHQLFYLMRDKYMPKKKAFEYNIKSFKRPGQLKLDFDLFA